MKSRMLATADYPPPPPPPSSSKMDSRKMLVIVLLLVIIIVSAGVLYYLATNQSSSTGNPTATPTPTGTGATPTPTGASPTATPSGSTQLGTYHAGTWAQYSMKTYESGELTSDGTLKYAIDEGTYSGTACWLMTYEMQINQDSSTMNTVMTYWIDKSTLEGIHVKTQIYMDDVLISETEEDLEPGYSGDMPEPMDITGAPSYETITVPAGTFYCGKVSVTTTVSGSTRTTSTWASSDVPVVGLVKIETVVDGAVTSTTELISYHS